MSPAAAAHYVSYYWGRVMRAVSPGKALAVNAGCWCTAPQLVPCALGGEPDHSRESIIK